MKVSSQTGFRGVEKTKRGFRAFHEKNGRRVHIGDNYMTASEAALEFDAYILKRKGIEFAFPILNFQKPELRREYEKHNSDVVASRAEAARWKEERLRQEQIDPKVYADLLRVFHTGTPVEVMAQMFGVHKDTLISKLKELESERLRSIGMAAPQIEASSSQTLREQVAAAYSAGESIRGIATRLDVDRKSVSRWLGLSGTQTEEAAHEND